MIYCIFESMRYFFELKLQKSLHYCICFLSLNSSILYIVLILKIYLILSECNLINQLYIIIYIYIYIYLIDLYNIYITLFAKCII